QIAAAAREEDARAISLSNIYKDLVRFGLKPEQPLRSLNVASAASRKAAECREKMRAETIAVSALTALAPGSENDQAGRIKATLDYAARVHAMRLPGSVSRWLLQQRCLERTANLKAMARDIGEAIGLQRQALQEAHRLLHFRYDEWCGGPVEAARLEAL